MFISFLTCLTNIRSSVKLGELKAKKKTNDETMLNTCPDYWTKQLVHNDKTNETIVMCYNLLNNDKEQGIFIDGTLSKMDSVETDDTIDYSFDTTFFNGSMGSNLSYYRDLAKYSVTSNVLPSTETSTTPTIETFQNSEEHTNMYGEFRPGHPDYKKFQHYHNNISIVATDDVSTTNPQYVSPHSHRYEDLGARMHSHNDVFDENDPLHRNQYKYKVTNSNFDYWINPRDITMPDSKTVTAIEINLNKLNKTENVCELAKLFNWSEASSKCMS
jgi:hypothetical protein